MVCLVLLVYHQTKMKAWMKVHTQTNNHKKLKFFICAAAVIDVSIFVINNVLNEPQGLVYYDISRTSTTLWKVTQPSDRWQEHLTPLDTSSLHSYSLHPQCTIFRMVCCAGWVLGHRGDAKIILLNLHYVPSMSHWTRWFMKGSFPSWLGLLTFETRLPVPDNLYCVGGDVKPCSFLTYMKLWKAQVPCS